MSSARLIGAAVLAAGLLTLTSCKADGSSDPSSPSPTPTPSASASADAGTTAPATPAGDGSPTAASPSGSDLPVDPEPSFDCGVSSPPAGHTIVQVTAAPSSGTLRAQSTTFDCDPNGGNYVGTGPARSYRLATGAVAQLNAGSTDHRTVTLSALSQHISACLQHASVPAPFTCSGNIYDVTVSPSSGEITRISEVWHS
jgi:hypothetical protein